MAFFTRYKELGKLIKKLENPGKKYICFIQLSKDEDVLFLCTTDGINLWRLEINEEDINVNMEAVGMSSKEAYLACIETAFKSGDIEVSIVVQILTLRLSNGSNTLTFELFETPTQSKKEGLQNLLFAMASKIESLDQNLKDADKKIEKLQNSQKTVSCPVSPFKEHDTKKPKMTRPKQGKGHSVINPGSKRKHAAKGVMFD